MAEKVIHGGRRHRMRKSCANAEGCGGPALSRGHWRPTKSSRRRNLALAARKGTRWPPKMPVLSEWVCPAEKPYLP